MTVATPNAARWTCDRCEVSVGRIDGGPIAQPSAWTTSELGTHCLSCSRALAGEAALDDAPEGCSSEDRVRLRRSALIEFEVRRVPDSSDRLIAQSCRTSASAVAAVRRGMSSEN